MKNYLTLLFICIGFSSFAQQENKFYIRITMADTSNKYNIYFEKYTNNIIMPVPYGKSVSNKIMQKIKFNDTDVTTANDIDYDTERKWYSYGNADSMFGSVVSVIIINKKTKQKMYIILPITLNAKWTEIYLQDVEFKAGKYIDILKHAGRFDEEDNTVKIIVNKKVKNKFSSTSSFKLPTNANVSPTKPEYKKL